MNNELFCAKHGPYEDSNQVCPWCANELEGRPVDPGSLADDQIATGIAVGNGSDSDTEMPQRVSDGGYDDDQTIMPGWRSGSVDDIDMTVVDRPEETGPLGWLVVKRDSPCFRRGHVRKVIPGRIYGRDPKKADDIIDDPKVSGLHARIKLEDDKFVIYDFGSRNGTDVNGESIDQSQALVENDEIGIGDTIFVLKTIL
jgi:hypothetical protein